VRRAAVRPLPERLFITQGVSLRLTGRKAVAAVQTAVGVAQVPEPDGYLRLFLEIHALALHDQETYGGYLRDSILSWRTLIADRLVRRGLSRRGREDLATVVIGAVDGLLLDFLATGDRERTTRAMQMFLRRLK